MTLTSKLKFSKATKEQAKGRLAIMGPPGSGKTFSALKIAQGLGKKIALIDTERGSASKYADLFDFDALTLDSFSPELYIEAIREAGKAGYDVTIVDSLSHAWAGTDGALDQVEAVRARSKSGNSYMAWREVTPDHNRLVDTILQSPSHVLATLRVKTEYVLETDDRGRQVPKKVGLKPIQREGLEYEFDVVGDIDTAHRLVVSKTRCPALDGKVFTKPGEDFAEIFAGWLGSGTVASRSIIDVLEDRLAGCDVAEVDGIVGEISAMASTLSDNGRARLREAVSKARARAQA